MPQTRKGKPTREQMLRAIDYAREKKRRLRAKKDVFTPNEGQYPVLNSTAKERWVVAANGSGKTTLAVHDAVWTAQGYNPINEQFNKVPIRVIVLLDAPAKVGDLWLPEIAKWFNTEEWEFNKRGKPYITEIILPNGSQILFMFHEQSQMAFESIEWGHLVMDEPPPRSVYVALKRGGRSKGFDSRVLEIGTPINQSWIRREVVEPALEGNRPGTEVFKFSTYVNKENLGDGYIEHYESILSEKEKRIRLHAEFYDLEGLALAHLFDRHVHVIEPFEWPRSWPCVIAIDPAESKPHVACLLGVGPGDKLYYIDEYSERAPARDFARALKQRWYDKYPIVDVVCDSFGARAQSGGEQLFSFIDVINDEGIRARSTTYEDKDDERWIAGIQEALLIPKDGKQAPKLRIFEGNGQIIHNIENAQWLKMRNDDVYKPKIDITRLDALACLKYALASKLAFRKPKAPIHKPSGVNYRQRRGL